MALELTIIPETENKIAAFNTEATPVLGKFTGLKEVKDDSTFAEVNGHLVELKKRSSMIEALRSEICDPFYKTWKNTSDKFKAAAAPFVTEYSRLNSLTVGYQMKKEQAIREANRKAEEEAEKARKKAEKKGVEYVPPPVMIPVEAPKTHYADQGSITYVTKWKSEVVDAKKVPGRYLVPDTRAIQKAVEDGVREIPGVKIYETKESRVR